MVVTRTALRCALRCAAATQLPRPTPELDAATSFDSRHVVSACTITVQLCTQSLPGRQGLSGAFKQPACMPEQFRLAASVSVPVGEP